MRIVLVIIVSLTVCVQSINGQNNRIELKAKYNSEQGIMLLRWAPNNSALWRQANKYGVTIEKYLYEDDGKLLESPLEKELLVTEYKPTELDGWEELVKKNDYAAIAAQCLYGESFGFTEASSPIMTIVNKSKEHENRYSFTLFASDQLFEVAKLSGLGYVDQDVRSDERYLYKLYPNIPDSIMRVDTSAVYYGAEDYAPLPKIEMAFANQDNGNVQIFWSKIPYGNEFTSFSIEKSTDNQSFQQINEEPIINIMEGGPSKTNRYGSFVDTSAVVGDNYFRVRGYDAFGFKSPYSDTLKVSMKPSFKFPFPEIDTSLTKSNGEVIVRWGSIGDKEYIDKVFLERADKADGRYELVDTKNELSYSLQDKSPKSVNYYRIGVLVFDQLQYSLPHIHNLIDSIPPAIPRILDSEVKDSLMVLRWNRSEDDDIAGYRVFKSLFKDEEPSMLADTKSTDTVFTLKSNLKFINNERFYFVSAYDKNGNTSKLSESYQVEVPDIIPPVAPVIESIEQIGDSIKIEWVKSSSDDIARFLIYSKNARANSYQLKGVCNSGVLGFYDEVLGGTNQKYAYKVVAVDSAGNEAISETVYINYTTIKSSGNVKYVITSTDNSIEITWETKASDKYTESKIYDSFDGVFRLIKTVPFTKGVAVIKHEKISAEQVKIIFL